MAEIEIILPTVQYGNVKVRATPEELGVDIASPAAVGTATAIYLNLFTQGFKVGAGMDVTASPTEGLKAPQSASESEVDQVIDDTLKRAQELVQSSLGATEVDDEAEDARTGSDYTKAPPWDQKVDSKPKPWETDVTGPGVLDAAW